MNIFHLIFINIKRKKYFKKEEKFNIAFLKNKF
jgi:hypothetical protein